ncbi:HNH endonuclease [Tenacibaculum finnmarkense]|uniref:HNH endonuclease n=1 Tax=Tenacibaculum TaxID=104267 RepID=UPI001EFCE9BB|nr:MULTISPECIES: HNH endonuclease [Tenacibaculum]MCG8806527.1 HNH endonuclease [Tenacibaculum finnmarkense]MCG8857672.1 HNH endonuclease [Tenacibaculum finnmarkense]
MIEKECYKCEVALSKTNSSTEHIILNACGGKLKSNSLLCKKCNSNFGESFDMELAKSITPLANLLKIKRDRGNPPKINGIDTINNTEYSLEHNGNVNLKIPSIKKIDFDNDDISKRKIQIQAPNEKILKQTLNGLKRKYPGLNVENALKDFTYNEKPFDNELKINMSIGGTETFKSITKTAINFYMLNNGNRDEIKHLFNYLDGKEDMNIVWFYYPNIEIYNHQDGEVMHILKIIGKKNERILYAYVELFSSHCFIIKLNENYNGENIDIDYISNVNTNEVKHNLTKLELNRVELINLFINKDVDIHLKVQNKASRVLNISQKRDVKNEISKSVNKIFNKHIGESVNHEILNELQNEFMRIIKPHINYGKK